jgi:hypothetical protein
MRKLSLLLRIRQARFLADKRGIAATEFALIAPALIFLVMGVLEMSMRFRASEEASRYVHEVADLISREEALTTASLTTIYAAAPYMMKPLTTTNNLDIDISSIGFDTSSATPDVKWRRYRGLSSVPLTLSTTAGMGKQDETVIRVGIRFRYDSVLTSMFGGAHFDFIREAYARPREVRVLTMNTVSDDGGAATSF